MIYSKLNMNCNKPHIKIKKIPLPYKTIYDLKMYQDLSNRYKWEYAGKIEFFYSKKTNSYKFNPPIAVTSRNRRRIYQEDLNEIWPSLLTFHTHPSIYLTSMDIKYDSDRILTTLPSYADFQCFIMNYPFNQSNIICDSHGYYIIDIIDSIYDLKLPVPKSVNNTLDELRCDKFLRSCSFSEDNIEYHLSTMKLWKKFINKDLNKVMGDLYGIKINYYSYHDIPPSIRLNSFHTNVKKELREI